MADLLINKQINLWRGPDEPPTKYHLWIVNDSLLRLYDGTQWRTFLDNPGLTVKENTDGTITIASGTSSFTLATSGSSLQIIKNGTVITIASNAISTIPTDEWLSWTGTLFHKDANKDLAIATYGPVVDSTGTSSFTVPYIKVDQKGHVVDGGSHTVSIPDKVVQNPIDTTQTSTYEVLLSTSSNTEREVGEANKDSAVKLEVTYAGGTATKVLHTPGIKATGGVTINGDVEVPEGFVIKGTVVGKVQGTATPTDHADPTTKYGAGTAAGESSVAMYGHVKLQDDLPQVAPPSGGTEAGKGIAASPLMVYNAVEESKQYADGLFGNDFGKDTTTNKYNLIWTEI